MTQYHDQAVVNKLFPSELLKQVRLVQQNLNEYEEYLDALCYNLGEMQNALPRPKKSRNAC